MEKRLEPSVDTEAGGCRRGGPRRDAAVFGSAGKQTVTFTGSQRRDDGDAGAKRERSVAYGHAGAARARAHERRAFPLSEKFMSKISAHGSFI